LMTSSTFVGLDGLFVVDAGAADLDHRVRAGLCASPYRRNRATYLRPSFLIEIKFSDYSSMVS
jgi:hypothetical protein